MTFVPSLAEDGTNAILCSPPTIMPFAFGPDSFRRHLEAARGLGLEPRIVRSPGIGLDIDLHGDLQRFMATPSDTRTRKFCLTHDPMAAATAVEGVR
jgi:2-phospho-L-lactate guanylyltransferase